MQVIFPLENTEEDVVISLGAVGEDEFSAIPFIGLRWEQAEVMKKNIYQLKQHSVELEPGMLVGHNLNVKIAEDPEGCKVSISCKQSEVVNRDKSGEIRIEANFQVEGIVPMNFSQWKDVWLTHFNKFNSFIITQLDDGGLPDPRNLCILKDDLTILNDITK